MEAEKMTGCNCPIDLKPMRDWVSEPTPEEECRPCVVGPAVQWYDEELRDRGKEDLAKELAELAEAGDTVQVCEKMDDIKASVPEDIRSRLLDFDCEVQSWDAEAIVGELGADIGEVVGELVGEPPLDKEEVID